MEKDPFIEYSKETEPSKREKCYAWKTAIGLQDVDGLKPSDYLIETAKRNIEGDITIDEVQDLLDTYYEENGKKTDKDRTQEADNVSARITKLLSEKAFSFTTSEYISIHKKLFADIYAHAGLIRDYNITKKEWVLDGQTVIYGTASEITDTINYDLAEEKKFTYQGLSSNDIIAHLTKFVSGLWQIHPFREGNTRTTAVFFIKYLRTLGYDVTNDIFADNAWYFRNALVRANYNDIKNGVHATTEYLELFLRNLLLGENNKLSNRSMHISHKLDTKVDIQTSKVDIQTSKVDIGAQKVDIGRICKDKIPELTSKSIQHIIKIYDKYTTVGYFGRSDIIELLNLSPAMTSRLLKTLLDNHIIEPVKGLGKGKYQFSIFEI